jgi:hypothetical protein
VKRDNSCYLCKNIAKSQVKATKDYMKNMRKTMLPTPRKSAMLPTQTALDSSSLISFETTGRTSLIVFDQPRLTFSPGSERMLRDFLNQETAQRCIVSGRYIVERLSDGAICLHGETRSTALSLAANERLRDVLNQATEQSEHEEDSGKAGRGGA